MWSNCKYLHSFYSPNTSAPVIWGIHSRPLFLLQPIFIIRLLKSHTHMLYIHFGQMNKIKCFQVYGKMLMRKGLPDPNDIQTPLGWTRMTVGCNIRGINSHRHHNPVFHQIWVFHIFINSILCCLFSGSHLVYAHSKINTKSS